MAAALDEGEDLGGAQESGGRKDVDAAPFDGMPGIRAERGVRSVSRRPGYIREANIRCMPRERERAIE